MSQQITFNTNIKTRSPKKKVDKFITPQISTYFGGNSALDTYVHPKMGLKKGEPSINGLKMN